MSEIEPQNLRALLDYRGRGNPPNTHPDSAIANCFPGLEFDFRNIWKHLFVGLELHESTNVVVKVVEGGEAAQQGVVVNHFLRSAAGFPVEGKITAPGFPPDATTFIEWANSLAELARLAGTKVECKFELNNGLMPVTATLEVRSLFDGINLAREVAEPGALTQGLCSPWQADYRECACFYWAANRPDFVNVEISGTEARGHNWLDKQRTSASKVYVEDNPAAPPAQLVTYEDLYRDWEKALKFQRRGNDDE